MILPGLRLVAARGSAKPVSYRGIGSANGNRTRLASVQLGSAESKCLQVRSVRSSQAPESRPQTTDVVTRLSLTLPR